MERLRRLTDHVAVGLTWRYFCHSLMLLMAILSESRAASRVPDLVLDSVPHIHWVWKYNYYIWIAAHLPPALWLWRTDRALFLRFLYVGGLVSLARGVCVPLTVLGPPLGNDVNAGAPPAFLLRGWIDLINPIKAVVGGAAHLYMTKDMFFSGHVATTFLLWLYARKLPVLGSVTLIAHLIVIVSVVLSHLHYTIDIVGAWAIAFSLFVLCERWFDRHSFFTTPPAENGLRDHERAK